MSVLKKYMFDVSFDDSGISQQQEEEQDHVNSDSQEEKQGHFYTQEEIDQMIECARTQAFNQGYEKSQQDKILSCQQEEIAIKKSLCDQLSDVLKFDDEFYHRLFECGVRLSLGLVHHIFPLAVDDWGKDQVKIMVNDVLKSLRQTCHVVIYVHPQWKSWLEDIMTDLMQQINFQGQVCVKEKSQLELGDCEISWDGGGVEKHYQKIFQDLEGIVQGCFLSPSQQKI